jgi:pumilio family protein 6
MCEIGNETNASSDTKLLAKSLLADLSTNLFTTKLYSEITGRRALLYPLVHRSPRHFIPALMSSLASTDPIRERTSKKAEGVRRDEVRRAVSEGYLAAVVRDLEAMISDPGGSLVLGEVMLFAEGGMEIFTSGTHTHEANNDR